jgi:Zn-dependent oligopeptidase
MDNPVATAAALSQELGDLLQDVSYVRDIEHGLKEPEAKRARVRPERVAFDWNYSIKPEDVLGAVDKLIAKVKVMYDEVADLKGDDVTFDNVVKKLDYIDNVSATEYYPLLACNHFAVSAEHTKIAADASKKWNAFEVSMNMRKDIFDVLMDLHRKMESVTVDAESRRYLDKMIFDGKRIGLHLSDAERGQIEEIAKELGQLKIKFRRNLDESDTVLYFTPEELDGTPEVTLNTMEKFRRRMGSTRSPCTTPTFDPS